MPLLHQQASLARSVIVVVCRVHIKLLSTSLILSCSITQVYRVFRNRTYCHVLGYAKSNSNSLQCLWVYGNSLESIISFEVADNTSLAENPISFFIGKERIEARVQNLVFQHCFPSVVNLSTIATIVLMTTPALRSYFGLIKCNFTLCKNLWLISGLFLKMPRQGYYIFLVRKHTLQVIILVQFRGSPVSSVRWFEWKWPL